MLNKFAVFLEWILFGSLLAVTVSGVGDGLVASFPLSFEIIGGIICVVAIFFALSRLRNPDWILPLTAAFGLSVMALAARHFSSIQGSAAMAAPLLYFFVIAASGLLGKRFTWVLSFFCLAAGEIVHSGLNSDNGLDAIISGAAVFPFLSSAAYLLITGMFTSLVAAAYPLTEIKKESTSPDDSSEKDPQLTVISSSVPDLDPTKTQKFTIERVSKSTLNAENDVQDLLNSVVYFMSRNFKAYSALAFVYNTKEKIFVLNSYQSKSAYIAKGVSIPLGKGVVGRIGSEQRSFMSGNFSNYNSETLYYTDMEEVNSILAVPVISEQHELMGVLLIDSKDKFAFKDQDKEILKRFSTLAAALISNARMRIYQERIAQTFKIFYQTSHHFTTALKESDVFDVLFQMIPMVAPCTRQMAIIYNEEKRCAVVTKIQGEGNDVTEGMEFKLNSGIYSYALQKRKIVNINDFGQYESKYYRFMPEEIRNPQLRSLIIFPITDDESRCRGLFSVESNLPDQYHGEIEQVMATIVENASVALTRALLYQQMERLATTDGLTELNNHRHFQEILASEVERSRRYKRPLSVLLLDIDHFKSFNDTYGHPVGDLVLKEISACIRKSIRINDVPARYGGEEFTVIIPETAEEGALITAERIRSTIESHVIRSLDKELKVTVSIGCATHPSLAGSQQELIDNADKALYYSKEHGRNQVSLFNQGMKGKEKK